MVDPYDEHDISNDDVLIRRIDPTQHLSWDDDRQCSRVSTKAFQASKKSRSGMSIDVEKLIQKDGIDPLKWVTTPRFRGLVWFLAGLVRNLGLRVGYEPVVGDGAVEANPYHGEIWGPAEKPYKITQSQQKQIHAAVEWYVELENVAIR